MNRWLVLLLLGVTFLALSGCGRVRLLPVEEPRWRAATEGEVEVAAVPPKVKKPRPVFEPLTYLDILRRMSDTQRAKEYDIVKKRFARSSEEDDRWRLIFLSLWPDQPFSDREQARKLLAERSDRANDPRRGLALVLEGVLDGAVERDEDCARELAAEKTRAETLHRQLEELKKIETILGEREKLRPAGR
ncbi:hypothetical protein [Trichloromonas acetexigens]|uniref:Uncharacterized protein n=1 Tax=Trichloromonas acetexigens TaxID=38815 RepID=A0A550JDB2_9BACT|nr:hypothetical protein [Desulfuromonas acetexigens]TRO81191.1 hypothetical protein FL622_09795 [Desulfuromonas acetexigens]